MRGWSAGGDASGGGAAAAAASYAALVARAPLLSSWSWSSGEPASLATSPSRVRTPARSGDGANAAAARNTPRATGESKNSSSTASTSSNAPPRRCQRLRPPRREGIVRGGDEEGDGARRRRGRRRDAPLSDGVAARSGTPFESASVVTVFGFGFRSAKCPSALRFLMSLKSFCLSPRSRMPNLARSIMPSAPNSDSVRPPRASWYFIRPALLSHRRTRAGGAGALPSARVRGPEGGMALERDAVGGGVVARDEGNPRSRASAVRSARSAGDAARGDARGDFRRVRWRAKSRASSGRACEPSRRSSARGQVRRGDDRMGCQTESRARAERTRQDSQFSVMTQEFWVHNDRYDICPAGPTPTKLVGRHPWFSSLDESPF